MTKSPWLSRKDLKSKRLSISGSHGKGTAGNGQNAQLPTGIINAANDCFANSVLQSLVATPLLEDMISFQPGASADPSLSPALCNGRQAAGPSEAEWIDHFKLSDTFLRFMEDAYRARNNPNARALNPRELIRALGVKFDQYLDFRQQDAHELLRHLLDGMYMDEMDVIKKQQPPRKAEPIAPQYPRRNGLEVPRSLSSPHGASAFKRKLAPFTSTVFGGRLASFVVCNSCKHISQTYEDFLDLSLPIKAEDGRKKGAWRAAIAAMFTTSVQPTSTAPPSNVPLRPTTPAGRVSDQKITLVQSSTSSAPSEPPTIVTPPAVSQETPTMDRPFPTSDSEDYMSQLGRRVSTKISRSRERFDHFTRSGASGARSGSRPTSADARAPPRYSAEKKPKTKRPNKPTREEAAYLQALLKDEPLVQHGLPNLLRGGVPLPASGSVTSPITSSHNWGRVKSSTTTLLDCLKMFTSVEILEGENSFACHKCWKMANPEEVEACRLRRRRKRRRRQSAQEHGNASDAIPSSESESDEESTSDSSSSEDEPEAHTGPSARYLSPSSYPLRPDLSARATSADAVATRHHTPSIGLAVSTGEAAIARRASLKNDSERVRSGKPLLSTDGTSENPIFPFPSNIPTISTSLPSPISGSNNPPTPKPSPFGPKVIPSSPPSSRPPSRPRRPPPVEVAFATDGDETEAEAEADAESAPRPRRFSSFHAEKFLSPNVSSDSLASAPPDEGIFSLIRRRKRGLSTLLDRDDETLADERVENVFATDDEASDADGGTRSNDAASSPQVPGLASRAPVHNSKNLQEGSSNPLSIPRVVASPSPVPSSVPPTTTVRSSADSSLSISDQGTRVEPDNRSLPKLPTSGSTSSPSPSPFSKSVSLPSETLPPGAPRPRTKRSDQVILRHAFKRYLIDAPPPVLVVHLKRFQQMHVSGRKSSKMMGGIFGHSDPSPLIDVTSSYGLLAGNTKKVDDYVAFPEYLDLSSFLAPKKEKFGLDERGRSLRTSAGGAISGKSKGHHHWMRTGAAITGEFEESPVIYRLYAVVVHIGSMLGGHYIAYTALPDTEPIAPTQPIVKTSSAAEKSSNATASSDPQARSQSGTYEGVSPVDGAAERQWCYTSDTIVRLASREEVMNSKAYLIFYERVPATTTLASSKL